ncbi:MAG: hypothetical protein FWG64_08565 [Firmicutes bacterium]|nr:hypothetical protein [Bacillota bacterium]
MSDKMNKYAESHKKLYNALLELDAILFERQIKLATLATEESAATGEKSTADKARFQKTSKPRFSPIKLHIIGGFAIVLAEIPYNLNRYTDIDYVGAIFDEETQIIIQKLGLKHEIGADWLNNQVLLEGSSLADLQFVVGKLRFEKVLDLQYFTVKSLVLEDVAKMKAIAIDTALMGADFGDEFTRLKDFDDIAAILQHLGWTVSDLRSHTGEYVLQSEVYTLIADYIKNGSNRLFE